MELETGDIIVRITGIVTLKVTKIYNNTHIDAIILLHLVPKYIGHNIEKFPIAILNLEEWYKI